MTPDENFASLSGRNESQSKEPTLAFANKTKLTKEDIVAATTSTLKWYMKLFLMGFLTIAIPVSVYLAQQRLDMQQRAASPGVPPSTPQTLQPSPTPVISASSATGAIVLDPNPCIISPGKQFCNSRVTFQFADTNKIQICEKGVGTAEVLLWESTTPNKITSFVHDKVASTSVTITMRTQETPDCSGTQITAATLSAQMSRLSPTPRAVR